MDKTQRQEPGVVGLMDHHALGKSNVRIGLIFISVQFKQGIVNTFTEHHSGQCSG